MDLHFSKNEYRTCKGHTKWHEISLVYVFSRDLGIKQWKKKENGFLISGFGGIKACFVV